MESVHSPELEQANTHGSGFPLDTLAATGHFTQKTGFKP